MKKSVFEVRSSDNELEDNNNEPFRTRIQYNARE